MFARSSGAPATYALIAINVLVFLAELGAGGGGGASFTTGSGGKVITDFGLFGPAISNNGEWYRIISGGFLHAGLLHIAFNMFALYVVGGLLEPAIGTPRFAAVYFASLLAGSFGALLVSPDTHTVGASGAIFGVFAAAFVIARGRRLDEIASQLGFLLILNLALTFGIAGISIGGHIGGALGGALCALAISAGERGMLGRRRTAAELAVIAGVAVASVVGALAVA